MGFINHCDCQQLPERSISKRSQQVPSFRRWVFVLRNAMREMNEETMSNLWILTGREVTIAVVKQLASNLGITQNAEPSHFIKDEEVSWKIDFISVHVSQKNPMNLSWGKAIFLVGWFCLWWTKNSFLLRLWFCLIHKRHGSNWTLCELICGFLSAFIHGFLILSVLWDTE